MRGGNNTIRSSDAMYSTQGKKSSWFNVIFLASMHFFVYFVMDAVIVFILDTAYEKYCIELRYFSRINAVFVLYGTETIFILISIASAQEYRRLTTRNK